MNNHAYNKLTAKLTEFHEDALTVYTHKLATFNNAVTGAHTGDPDAVYAISQYAEAMIRTQVNLNAWTKLIGKTKTSQPMRNLKQAMADMIERAERELRSTMQSCSPMANGAGHIAALAIDEFVQGWQFETIRKSLEEAEAESFSEEPTPQTTIVS